MSRNYSRHKAGPTQQPYVPSLTRLLASALPLLALAFVLPAVAAPNRGRASTRTKAKPGSQVQRKAMHFMPKRSRGTVTASPISLSPLATSLMGVPPAALSAKALGKRTSLEVQELNWAYLDAGAPRRAGRASLSFFRPLYVAADTRKALFKCEATEPTKMQEITLKPGPASPPSPPSPKVPCNEAAALLRIEATKPEIFVVDCTARSSNDASEWVVRTADAESRSGATGGWDQIVFVINATKKGTYEAALMGTSELWTMARCTVNTAT